MLYSKTIKILIIDDDEDDYFIVSDFINDIEGAKFLIEWCSNGQEAIEQFKFGSYDLYFIDYRLGNKNGLDILKEAIKSNCDCPIILLTGKGNKEIDVEAMKSGATDYLIKSELSSEKLERCMRYSLDRAAYLRAVKESETKYRNLFSGSKDAVFIADKELFFKEVNLASCTLFNKQHIELQDQQLYDFIRSENQKEYIKKALSHDQDINDLEIEIENTGYERKTCTLSILQETTVGGRNMVHGIIHDITNIKKAEKVTLQTEKLAANERLVRILAHEIRNPLNNIQLSADHLDMIIENEPQQKAVLGIIQRNGLRINQLITELLNSTKTRDLVFQKYSLQEVVETGLSFAIDRINLHNVKLETILPETPFYILADKSRLAMGFSNLLINAIEAMNAGTGELEVQVGEKSTVYFVSIKDNGKGIPADQMSKLFEPFFTMKKNGMGLGLSAAYSIFKSHGSEVLVESIEKSGTTFTIEFSKDYKFATEPVNTNEEQRVISE